MLHGHLRRAKKRKSQLQVILCAEEIIFRAGWGLRTNHVAVGAVLREHLEDWKMLYAG
jgi:hypothetical protein